MPLGKSIPAEVKVLPFFEEISKIPRRSFLTAPIADYLCAFAKEHGLWCYRDGSDNVIIKKTHTRMQKAALPLYCKRTRTWCSSQERMPPIRIAA